jgi:hypothetical protein
MMANPSLLDEVMQKAVSTRFWLETMPPDFADELYEVRASFVSGKIPARRYTIANVIIANGKARGLKMPSEKTVADWLNKSDD